MRQLGTLPDEAGVRRFADYLLTKGIRVSVDRAPEGWKIWVYNEDDLEPARREFAAFSAAPDAAVYHDSAGKAEELRVSELRRARAAQKQYVNIGAKWRSVGATRLPVTSALVAISVAVFLLMQLGNSTAAVDALQIVPFDVWRQFDGHPPVWTVWFQEPWRLLTPIFLHFGILHILFNMMMTWQLGRAIEIVRGSGRLLLFALVIGISSNVVQYYWGMEAVKSHLWPRLPDPGFGGMSGVVYGLFGYLWMKSRYEPASGFHLTRDTVIWIMGWYVLCLVGVIPNVANAAHGAGLLVGMVLGRARSAWQKL